MEPSPTWSRIVGLAVAGCVLASALTGPAGVAVAEPGGGADARAVAALREVQTVQRRVDAALAAYQQAVDDATAAVSRGISAEQRANDAGLAAGAVRDAAGARTRALYRTGGPLEVYASVLSAHDLGDAALRLRVARQVVGRDGAVVAAATATQQRAAASAGTAERRALSEIRGTRAVLDSYARLSALLDRQQQLLAQAALHARQVHDAEDLARRQVQEQRLAAARAAAQAAGAAKAAAEAAGHGLVHRIGPMPGSDAYFALYRAAARTCPGLSWTVLAAIGQVESGHGRNPGTSSAGAQGPMQFLPATFEHYAVDGDGDGNADIMSPADAIFTAARYLCANGAGTGPAGLRAAIWHYNHADWYVELVLDLAAQYAAQRGP